MKSGNKHSYARLTGWLTFWHPTAAVNDEPLLNHGKIMHVNLRIKGAEFVSPARFCVYCRRGFLLYSQLVRYISCFSVLAVAVLGEQGFVPPMLVEIVVQEELLHVLVAFVHRCNEVTSTLMNG